MRPQHGREGVHPLRWKGMESNNNGEQHMLMRAANASSSRKGRAYALESKKGAHESKIRSIAKKNESQHYWEELQYKCCTEERKYSDLTGTSKGQEKDSSSREELAQSNTTSTRIWTTSPATTRNEIREQQTLHLKEKGKSKRSMRADAHESNRRSTEQRKYSDPNGISEGQEEEIRKGGVTQ